MYKSIIVGTAHGHIFGMAAIAKSMPNMQVLGVWDDDAARLAEASKKLGVPAIKTLDEALALKPHVVIGAAVPGDRANIALRAIEAGAAAFIDKPLAVTHKALDELIAGVEKFKKPVITYYPYRGFPHLLSAKAALDAGKIGKLVRVFSAGPHKLNPGGRPEWHWTRAGNGGALIDIGSHHADIICFFANQSPNWVSGIQGNFDQPTRGEFQDFAQAMMRFPSGVMGHVEVDWLNPTAMKNFGDTRTWIQGTKGKIEIRLGDTQSIEMWNDQVSAQPLDVTPYPSEENWCAKLIEDLAAGRPCAVPQADVWRASRVTLHLFDSASAGGRPVEIR